MNFLLQLKDNCMELPQGCDIPAELVLVPKKPLSSPALLAPQKSLRQQQLQQNRPSMDSLESFQRNVQSFMNKLSPENFPSVSEKLKTTISSGMDTLTDPVSFLTSVVEGIFEKAVRESRYAECYSQLCVFLSQSLPQKGSVSFKSLLLKKCQMEFDQTHTTPPPSPSPASLPSSQSLPSLLLPSSFSSSQEIDPEEIRNRQNDRNNGVPQFIGTLFLHGLISEKIIHYCLRTLLLTVEEANLMKFAALMTLIGKTIDHPKAKVLMDTYFVKIETLTKNKVLGTRIRFKLIDVVELRNNQWMSRKPLQLPQLPPQLQPQHQLQPQLVSPAVKSEINKQVNVQEGR